MTFDQDFGYSFPLLSPLLKKEGKEMENELAKIVIKVHAFLLNLSFVVTRVNFHRFFLDLKFEVFLP
jgi:hypothetical protein